MKRYISSASKTKVLQPLAEYVGKPFDLGDEDVQYMIAEWAENTLFDTLESTPRWKGRTLYGDDLTWTSKFVSFDVMDSESNEYLGKFKAALNFFDGPSEDYNDVQYMIEEEIKDFML